MSFENLRVLLLDGAGRQVLPMLKWLYDLNCDVTTVNSSKLDIGYSSRFPKHKLLVADVKYNANEKDAFVDSAIKSGNYDVVIPLSDLSTQYISKHLDEYLTYVKTFVPEYSVFMKAYDKQQTMEICQKNGIPCTLTKETDETFDEFISKVGYPIVVKPRSACGSVGFRCLHNEGEWKSFIQNNPEMNDYVVQEYVNQDGNQYNVHMFLDKNGEMSVAVSTQKCRWFPTDGGASCFCRTVDRPDLIEQCAKLLKIIGWQGYCDVDLIEDKKTGLVKVIEINGRASANIRICQLLGINVAENMLELSYEQKVRSQVKEYSDMRMRCIHTDLLWLLKSKNRFKSSPSWFDIRHTHDQIFSMSDPVPFLTFSLQSLLKLRKELKKRRR